MDPPAASPNGLCDTCAHQKRVPNTRGSVFSLCMLSRTDGRFPRYPTVPVRTCSGHESRDDQPSGPCADGPPSGPRADDWARP